MGHYNIGKDHIENKNTNSKILQIPIFHLIFRETDQYVLKNSRYFQYFNNNFAVTIVSFMYSTVFSMHSRPETYPKSFYFKPPDPPPKKGLFWGGSVPSNIFFNFGDMILIQNMKNIKSKFWIDLEYFSQHLVNTSRFRGK